MTTLLAGSPLAVNNFGDTLPGGLAGPMGLLIISLLAIGTVLLIRNMNARLRRLPASFDTDEGTRAADGRPTRTPAGPHETPSEHDQ